MPAESRPAAHFTPTRGWINDPYGVTWDGRRYHMYYQALPDRTTWAPTCGWGHAVSRDLVAWEEKAPALVPGAHERGCWSGSVIARNGLGVRAFYTRIVEEDPGIGQIALAKSRASGPLISGPGDVVIANPPRDLGVRAFRDPYVWRHDRGWRMIVGAGMDDGTGAVLQYRSTDLDHWRYTGIVRRGLVPGPHRFGRQVWECPQMIRIENLWVLVVSVQSDDSAGHVATCAGTYDGERFVSGEWSRLVFGTAPYATSLFQDRYRRPCMISWLREDPDLGAGKGWSGAHSLVSTLTTDAPGHFVALPHPDVLGSGLFTDEPRGDAVQVMPGVAHHLRVTRDGPSVIEVRRQRECLARVSRARDRPALVVERPGRGRDLMPCGAGRTIELFVDADILELFSDGVYGAWRLASTSAAQARRTSSSIVFI